MFQVQWLQWKSHIFTLCLQALTYYDRSIQFNNKDESSFVNRAIAKAVIKDHIGALEDFTKALTLSPKSAHIYFNRGNLYATMGM